jgi:hypothetical protein
MDINWKLNFFQISMVTEVYILSDNKNNQFFSKYFQIFYQMVQMKQVTLIDSRITVIISNVRKTKTKRTDISKKLSYEQKNLQ